MTVKLIWTTPDAEKHIAYCARVSSPNQGNPEISKLLKYCLKHHHMSVFEMASMCVEITTSRAISAQILRHKSFSFQEFSQRYAKTARCEWVDCRSQDLKNRQSSHDDLDLETKEWWLDMYSSHVEDSIALYEMALERGIAKECARFLLPMSSTTKLYMTGNLRSWITYFDVRCTQDTQLEHRMVAQEIKDIFNKEFPIIAEVICQQH